MSPYATLRGRVVGSDGEPAVGVEVEIRSYLSGHALHSASTDSDGSFVFDRLTAGSFYLLATPKPSSPKSEQETSPCNVTPSSLPEGKSGPMLAVKFATVSIPTHSSLLGADLARV
jgi:hypothetical protein